MTSLTAQKIVKIEKHSKAGLLLQDVYGLNIFASNKVTFPTREDPRIVFLRSLSERFVCSAHTGNLFDMADTPEELFGPADGANSFLIAHTGVYGGHFYDATEWNNFPACIFPIVQNSFWSLPMRGDGKGMLEIVEWDALALYVGLIEGGLEKIRNLAKQPFPGDKEWLQQVIGLYRAVIITGGDGFYIHAYVSDAMSFELLNPAIDEAVKAIESNEWYQQNKERLVWEPELSLCLGLPEQK